MAGIEVSEAKRELELPSHPSLVVGIAIKGNRKSKYVVNWALEKFVCEGNFMFKLLHVRPRIDAVPTPMGNLIPISEVRDEVVAAYKRDVEWQTSEMLLLYKRLCASKKVKVEVIVIESNDVAKAIADEVAKGSIRKLVIGATSRGIFTRRFKRNYQSSRISISAPKSCTVYAVSKGKLISIRPSDLETNVSFKDGNSETGSSSNFSSSDTSGSQTGLCSVGSYSHFQHPSLPMQRFQALSTVNQTLLHSRTSTMATIHSRCQSLDIFEEKKTPINDHLSSSDIGYGLSLTSSFRSLPTENHSCMSDQTSISDVDTNYSPPESQESQVNINFELEKLRIELRHLRGMCAIAQRETIDASRKLNNLNNRRMEEASNLKEINLKEEKAKELARQENENYKAAKREAAYAMQCREREISQRRDAEMKAARDAKEKEKLENALTGNVLQYQNFTWEEIVSATSSFSEDLKIGIGAYGTVYKCHLHHTTAAVKVLHSKENRGNKQFQRELEILSKIRHPHLLLLIGACPDHGCLVYEYMKNGSLEDRLLRKNNTSPIPWFDRYRIAWEVASALVFLHNSKPKPIIHRDLKPGNILLDHNFVSKIGDVGLSTMLSSDIYLSTMYKDTGPVGTLCYMDPEYQRTGLISPMSDVYALGMVILQLLTAKHAIGLTDLVERAINDNRLMNILDSEAGEWPIRDTKELAMLGLSCAELRRRDRPDLQNQVLPTLERLKGVANKTRQCPSSVSTPPNHFICPIIKEVMNDPCVAADGYTYDRKAIEIWLKENDKSPMSNLPLPNKNLIPNYTLLSAIMEWKSRR